MRAVSSHGRLWNEPEGYGAYFSSKYKHTNYLTSKTLFERSRKPESDFPLMNLEVARNTLTSIIIHDPSTKTGQLIGFNPSLQFEMTSVIMF